MKCLIVDDSITSQVAIRKLLENIIPDIEIKAVSTGKFAISTYPKFEPDFVTMDVIMGEMDGIEASRELGKIDEDAKIIIISVKEHSMKDFEDIPSVKKVVLKPITEEKLEEALKEIKIL